MGNGRPHGISEELSAIERALCIESPELAAAFARWVPVERVMGATSITTPRRPGLVRRVAAYLRRSRSSRPARPAHWHDTVTVLPAR